jgi:glycosyltransferase involved in cell wall biosynthesis
MIEPDVNGLVVPPADVDALVEGMRRLAADPTLLARLKRAAAGCAKDFEYPVVAERRAAMLRALLDRRVAPEAVAVGA